MTDAFRMYTAKYPISIAPMMDWTDRHYRYFMRLITKKTLLYTEMITCNAILRGNRDKLLHFSPEESPLVLQLGGDKPDDMAECTKIAASEGYTGVNINVGCPSDRVQNGNFGACLMATPELVAECFAEMQQAASIPVTIKSRIGIDGKETYEDLHEFVRINAAAGCQHFIVHARIAILQGLSPAENRKIPPLRYEDVYQLKKDFPHLQIELNGGIREVAFAREALQQVDSVMIGRAAYENPFLFHEVDSMFFGENPRAITRAGVLEALIPYIQQHTRQGGKINQILRHTMGLFHGVPGAKQFKRYLSENMYRSGADAQLVKSFLQEYCAQV
ncbi:MAG: tRNA dihydrouridine(20/20a) synthase DusA [Spirochaetota bacterium]